MTIPEIIDATNKMMDSDLVWNDYCPNNIRSNGVEGFYTVILHQTDSGIWTGRKYTIKFQYKENEDGLRSNEIEYYLLYEKTYREIFGSLKHPAPSETPFWNSPDTLNDLEVNDFGTLVRVFTNLDNAKKRALKQYKMVFGFAMSHLI